MGRSTLIAFGAAVSLLTGCGEDPSRSGPDPLSATYTLQTIGGEAVPLHLSTTSSSQYTIRGGEIEFGPNRTFTLTTRKRSRIGPEGSPSAVVDTVPLVKTGTYVTSGTALVLTAADGGTESVTLQGSTLTRADLGRDFVEAVPWVYTR